MSQRYITVTEEDYKQAIILSRMLLEGKYELKGDALPVMYKAQAWFVNHLNALKNPGVLPEPQKQTSIEPTAVESISNIKVSNRKKK